MTNKPSLGQKARKKAAKFQKFIREELKSIGIDPRSPIKKGHYTSGHITHKSRNWWIGRFDPPELRDKAMKHILKLKVNAEIPKQTRYKGDGLMIELPSGLKNTITRSNSGNKKNRKRQPAKESSKSTTIKNQDDVYTAVIKLSEQAKSLAENAKIVAKMVKEAKNAIPKGYTLVPDAEMKSFREIAKKIVGLK